MKRSKLIFAPIIATCAVAPIAMVTGCNQKSEAELIADAIIEPTKITTTTKITTSYIEKLNSFTDDEKKACLIYDLFGLFNIKGWRSLPTDNSFTSLYTNNIVSIATNITKCNYSVNSATNEVTVNLLGYVSFIFNENLADAPGSQTLAYHKNDYVMVTYDIQNRVCAVDETNCCLTYKPSTTGQQEVIGMIKELRGGEGAVSKLYSLESLDPSAIYKPAGLPINFKNLSK